MKIQMYPYSFRFSQKEINTLNELAELARTTRHTLVRAMVTDYCRILKEGREEIEVKENVLYLLDRTRCNELNKQ